MLSNFEEKIANIISCEAIVDKHRHVVLNVNDMAKSIAADFEIQNAIRREERERAARMLHTYVRKINLQGKYRTLDWRSLSGIINALAGNILQLK